MQMFKIKIALTVLGSLVLAIPATAQSKIPCFGREYPAKVITVFARSARLDVDLGFGLSYQGIVELDGTKEPNKPVAEWYGKASEALSQKIYGKLLTICVVNGEGKEAYFYVDGNEINRGMIKEGFLDAMPTPPFGVRTDF